MPKSDGRPRHQQIAADLRALLLSGGFTDRLPPTAVLAHWFSTTGNTVQHAVDILKSEGLVEGKKGVGVMVVKQERFAIEAVPYYDPKTSKFEYDILDVAVVPVTAPKPELEVAVEGKPKPLPPLPPETVPADVVKLLNLGAVGAAVRRLRIMKLKATGAPVDLSWSYYPMEIAQGTDLVKAGKISGGAPRVLEELGLPQLDFEDRVSTRPPTTQEVELLNLPEFVTVLRTLRVVRSHDRKPVEATVMVKGGHLLELSYSRSMH
jgi:GntR family transcriptional regulator